MTVEIGAEAALFPEKEYIKGIFVAVWCVGRNRKNIQLHRCEHSGGLHCKDKMPKIWNKYSQFPHSCVCLWANYIFPRWVCLSCWRKYVDRSWEYINRSQTHGCWNWGWGRAIPRKGIHEGDFRCSVVCGPEPEVLSDPLLFLFRWPSEVFTFILEGPPSPEHSMPS
jgi:hypothetical protein